MKEKHENNCLYRMYDEDENLLYIGMSTKFMSRLDAHWSSKDWIGSVKVIKVEHFNSKLELSEAERKAIKLESPLYNISLNKFKERPSVKHRKKAQREAFSKALTEYIESTDKSWFSCAYELGACHTAMSRWKNARICPGQKMLKKIEAWSGGAIKAEDFSFSKF